MNQLVESLTISGIAGILTAVVTVLLTFHFYHIRDQIRSLRALRTEVEENESLALHNGKGILSDMNALQTGTETGQNDVLPFSTTAFDSARNSGVLLSLSDSLRERLTIHYRNLNQANSAILRRQGLRQAGVSEGYAQLSIQADISALSSTLMVYPYEDYKSDLRDYLELITDGTVEVDSLIKYMERQVEEGREEVSDFVASRIEIASMESLQEGLSEELNGIFWSRFI